MDLHGSVHSTLQSIKVKKRPISCPIDDNAPGLDDAPGQCSWKVKFHIALGMISWLNSTNRPDVAYAHSRIGQYQANPNQSAMDHVIEAFGYLKGSKHLQLSSPRGLSNSADLSACSIFDTPDDHGWEFYCDSDYAGNSEPINKRRSQNGYIALLNGAPVYWQSKVSSVCFANGDIGEAHADQSSAAAEIFCAGNATQDFLHLSYVADEMGLAFPKPFKLQMDNEAALAFAKDSCFKTKLKHIDTRQQWVKMLRDKGICQPVHVPTKDNLADIFTKILPVADFTRLRDQVMHDPTASVQ